MVLGNFALFNLVLGIGLVLYIYLWLHNQEMAQRLTVGIGRALGKILYAVGMGLYNLLNAIINWISRFFR